MKDRTNNEIIIDETTTNFGTENIEEELEATLRDFPNFQMLDWRIILESDYFTSITLTPTWPSLCHILGRREILKQSLRTRNGSATAQMKSQTCILPPRDRMPHPFLTTLTAVTLQ